MFSARMSNRRTKLGSIDGRWMQLPCVIPPGNSLLEENYSHEIGRQDLGKYKENRIDLAPNYDGVIEPKILPTKNMIGL